MNEIPIARVINEFYVISLIIIIHEIAIAYDPIFRTDEIGLLI